jgi:hypothetical protein
VRASNSVGTGPASSPSNAAVPATIPGAPTGVSAQAGDGAATVAWRAPSNTGGSAITSYTVASYPGGITRTVTGTTATVTGLTNGTSYTFTVTATNAVGSGPASTRSSSITPAAQTALTAGLSTSALTYGRSVTLSAKLTNAGTTVALPGRPVRLYLRKHGTTTWTYLTTAVTSSTGTATYSHRPAWNVDYMWRYDGKASERASATGTRTVSVAVAISATMSKSSMPLDSSATLYGSVAPGHPGQYVYVQRYYSSAWHNVVRLALSSTSTWRYTVKPSSRGTYYYRVYKTADADHTAGASPTRTVKVY